MRRLCTWIFFGIVASVCLTILSHSFPQNHKERSVYLRYVAAICVQFVVLAGNPVNLAAALVGVLGLRTAEIPATTSSIIHGLRASRLAKVTCGETDFCNMHYDENRVICHLFLSCIHDHWMRYLYLLSNANARVCTEPPTTTRLSVTSSSNECLKCVKIKQSGKFSCCARGGAWFNKCGHIGETKFDHTWAEGIQACKNFSSSMSVKSPLKFKFHNVGVMAHPVNTAQPHNVTQKTVKIYHYGITLNAVSRTTDSDDIDDVTKTAVWVCVLCIVSHSQM